jgi:hypothetical protein
LIKQECALAAAIARLTYGAQLSAAEAFRRDFRVNGFKHFATND